MCVCACVYFCSFDGDVDAFGSMTMKITEIKTRNNSTPMFKCVVFLIYVFSGLNNTYVQCSCMLYVGCQTGTGKYLLAICNVSHIFTGKFSSIWKFPFGDLIFDAVQCTLYIQLHLNYNIVDGKTFRIFVGHCLVLVFALSCISLCAFWDLIKPNVNTFGKLKNYFELRISFNLSEKT